jgi:hypothetical protein
MKMLLFRRPVLLFKRALSEEIILKTGLVKNENARQILIKKYQELQETVNKNDNYFPKDYLLSSTLKELAQDRINLLKSPKSDELIENELSELNEKRSKITLTEIIDQVNDDINLIETMKNENWRAWE